ncbi:like/WD repeat-containing protein TBL1X [Seminavis robusta]|uniref:Like/WD repeat-containing protein TBL1X n=1 Tax=Seminavis robusta TaxID=568900 RepID=A0A9N8E5X7_9STRA|nr:like/WD repeat-containing protein TBL1X [Seminavis robusta]|eukprot:Sro576_g169520.1 like/WD repeat-containing protein TBL1X (958) ;mRNA; f:27437-30384
MAPERGSLASKEAPSAAAPDASAAAPADANNVAATETPAAAAAAAAAKPDTATAREGLLDAAVLEYLKKKGMESAASELGKILKEEGKSDDNKKGMEEDDRSGLLAKATGGGFGYDRDAAAPVAHWGVPDTAALKYAKKPAKDGDQMGYEEARALLDSFTSFQLWVLSLPDQDGVQSAAGNAIAKAQEMLRQGKKDGKPASLSSVVQTLTNQPAGSSTDELNNAAMRNKSTSHYYQLPPSVKPELFAVSFALMVHTYCELLEVGMESTAHVLRDTFRTVYEPMYGKEMADLFQCVSTEDMMRLNSHNAQHMESLGTLKGILVQVANYQLKRDELNASATQMDDATQAAKKAKLQEYDRAIAMLRQKYNEVSQKASMLFNKMHDLPFLRRARAVRWQLSLSTTTHSLLAAFLNANDTSLLAMNTLLQTKCELHVEQRDPLAYTPACVLDDNMDVDGETTLKLNKSQISWAAPMVRQDMDAHASDKLAFPKFQLDKEYSDSAVAQKEKELVEFNRALLVNGFRRLEALERKQEYEVLPELRILKDDPNDTIQRRECANPLEPTILLSTICCTAGVGTTTRRSLVQGSSSSSNRSSNYFDKTTAMWEEAGIGLCCAKICPPDGRQIAVGCDDAAVRIYHKQGEDDGEEPEQVLLGHKNGFPVFDLSWNRDGRSLLSAAGDGTVRLWDTRATGTFGTPKASGRESSSSRSSTKGGMNVPKAKKEESESVSGAALAVYRGHAPSTPVWSVSFSPCGYYFATAGADATVRLWTTDREVPCRLFTGHTSMIVNCADWNPNCNYIISGSEDKTARLWDIHSGRTVRLLNGCSLGITAVKISPCGKYAAGADSGGDIHIWDVGTGKKVTEFRNKRAADRDRPTSMMHAMSFSACGSSLAVGGDNCCVRIWDVRRESLEAYPVVETPIKSYPTRQTMIMDLKYSSRNLLLSVGKYIAPVPSPVMISD